jgi:hypothetical protein
MTVRLDDWALSGLSGTMDWAVMLPPGALLSPSSSCEQAHYYPSLYTELTPTVLTGSKSASTAAVGAGPIVYARLSSIVNVEKVGPRQLRLRQQLGWPGSYRLIFLTASSESACDDWWRVLYHLLCSNNIHSADTTLSSIRGEDGFHEQSNNRGGAELWRGQQQLLGQPRIKVIQSETAMPRMQSSDAGSGAPPNTIKAVEELKRVLLSPTPHTSFTEVGRPSLHLSAPPPLSSPLPTNPAPPLQRNTETPAALPQSVWSDPAAAAVAPPHVLPDAAKRTTPTTSPAPAAASPSASTIDTTTTATASTTQERAAREPLRHYRRHRHRDDDGTSSLPSAVTPAVRPSPQSDPLLPPPPPLVIPRATRSDATQTGTPTLPLHLSKPVVAPGLSALLQDQILNEVEATNRSSAVLREEAASSPPHPPAGPSRTTGVLSPLKDFASFTQATLRPTEDEQQEEPHAPLRAKSTSKPMTTPPPSTHADVPTEAAPPSWRLQYQQQQHQQQHHDPQRDSDPADLRLNGSESSASPSPLQNNPFSVPSWKTARALLPVTPATAADSLLYEPIHIDTAVVPRARSTSPPVPRLRDALSYTFSTSTAVTSPYQLSWRIQGASSLCTPRLTYGSTSPLWRTARGGPLLLLPSSSRPHAHLSGIRRHGQRSSHRGRSPNASTAKLRSRSRHSSGSRHRSRTASPAGSACAADVSQLFSIIAKPHLFLKYPVQAATLHRSSSSSGKRNSKSAVGGVGAAGDGVATYVFVTTDEECVVAVPAWRFKECVEGAKLLKGQHGSSPQRSRTRNPSPFAMSSLSIGVRSYERAKRFFGEDHCRAIRVADVDRITRGNEEPLILLHTSQRERFRDPAKLVCIVSHTHAFLMEATNSAEAEWYAQSWKRYMRIRRGPHNAAHRRAY